MNLVFCSATILLVGVISASVHQSRDGGTLPNGGKIWAVLVASSANWLNYAEEASVCHAFHSLRARGVPEEQIIVMMYDDIAFNPNNHRTPGIIVNRPGGPDVYHGVPKDYTKKSVNPEVLLAILRGNNSHPALVGRKTLDSGPNDHVFLYLTDHGHRHLVRFMYLKNLYESDFRSALESMRREGRYGKMAVYVDTCFAGSMFDDWEERMREMDIYANTASSPYEFAYDCCNDPLRETAVSSVFTFNWLNYLDASRIPGGETMEQLFAEVRNRSKVSTVCQYGSREIAGMPFGAFFGMETPSSDAVELEQSWPWTPPLPIPTGPRSQKFSSMLRRAVESASNTSERQRALDNIKSFRKEVDEVGRLLGRVESRVRAARTAGDVSARGDRQQCYRRVVDVFTDACFGGENSYDGELLTLVLPAMERLCAVDGSADDILAAVKKECSTGSPSVDKEISPRIEVVV